jgi:Na+/H+ antiporter NhaC
VFGDGNIVLLTLVPYAVFSYVSPLLTVALAYAGFRMLRVT